MKKILLAIAMIGTATSASADCGNNISFDQLQDHLGSITETQTKNIDYWSMTPKYNVQIKTKSCKKWTTVGKWMGRDKLHLVAGVESEIRQMHNLGDRKELLEEKAEKAYNIITDFKEKTVLGQFISASRWDCSAIGIAGRSYAVCNTGTNILVSEMK
jgi:hypothetical protein